jgi:hypothetical protein
MDLACTEADVGIMPGASARIRRAFVANAFQSGQGRELDAAYTVASSDPKTHWRDGYVLTDINGHPAVDPNGTLFAIRNYGGPLTAAWGFDLQQANLTEGILRTPSVTLGNGYLSIERPNAGLELGSLTEPGLAYVDFHTSGKPSDYDARIIASEGAGKLGGGTLTLQAHQVKVAGAAVFSHAPPSEPSSPCREGTVTWSRSHIYICVGTDRWRRAALSDW